MALATIFNSPREKTDRLIWSFANADHHLDVLNAIAKQKNILLARYLLDPIPDQPLGMESWLQTHQQAHNDINGVLGVKGNDISDVEFNNEAQVLAWTWLHATEHYQWANILGVA